MALICLGSVGAAPGVTTLSVLMAASWPRPAVLIEADPSGGVLAVRYRLGRSPGLSGLAAVVRQGAPPEVVWAYSQMLPGDLPVVVAPESGPITTNILRDASHELARWCGYHRGADVIVDCGRLAVEDVTWPLWAAADEMLLVTRPRADELYPVAHRYRAMESHVRSHGIVLVGDRPYRPEEVATQLRLPIRGTVADDARAAGVLARGGSGRTLRRSALVRSVRSLVDGLALRLGIPVVSPDDASLPVAEPDRRRRRRARGTPTRRTPTPPRPQGGPLPRVGETAPAPGPAQADWQPAGPAAPPAPGDGAGPAFTPMPSSPPGGEGPDGPDGVVPLGPAGPAGPAPAQEEPRQPPPPPPSMASKPAPEAPPSTPSGPDDSQGPESPDDPGGGTRRTDGQPQPKQPTPSGEMRDRSGLQAPPPPPRVPPPPSIPPPPPAYRPKRTRGVGDVAATAAAPAGQDEPEPLGPVTPHTEARLSEAEAGDDPDELSSAIQAADALGSKIEELSELAKEEGGAGDEDGAARTPKARGNDHGTAMEGDDGDSEAQGAVIARSASGPATLPLDELQRTAAMLADGAHPLPPPPEAKDDAGHHGSQELQDGGRVRKPGTGVNRTIEAPGGKIIINLPPLERRNGHRAAKAARAGGDASGGDTEPIEPEPGGQSSQAGPAIQAGQAQDDEAQADEAHDDEAQHAELARHNETKQTANPGPEGDAHLEPTSAASAAAAGGAASGRPTTAPPGPGAARARETEATASSTGSEA